MFLKNVFLKECMVLICFLILFENMSRHQILYLYISLYVLCFISYIIFYKFCRLVKLKPKINFTLIFFYLLFFSKFLFWEHKFCQPTSLFTSDCDPVYFISLTSYVEQLWVIFIKIKITLIFGSFLVQLFS